jgi:glycine dehydrogenase subunit 1
MLAAVGVSTLDNLFDALPAQHRDPPITLDPPLPEAHLLDLLRTHAARNRVTGPSFLGAGAYQHAIPAVTASLTARSEFVTAYTPYQPEISQATLQSGFEFQSVVCELTGLDVANTGLYDGTTATAEAALLAARVNGRRTIAVLEPIHPNTVDVIRTYAYGADLDIETIDNPGALTENHAALIVQQPDFLGAIHDLEPLTAAAHDIGALCIVNTDPFALGLLRPPGDAGADIVTAEGRDLAGPFTFGGPSLGLFAAKQDYLRQMPGRIVGRTKEIHGPRQPDGTHADPRTGYVLTLQAREQFIRRERATSNFSTGQSLVALAFTITVQALGPRGLRRQAEFAYQNAHDLAARIDALPGYDIDQREPWFQEFLLRGPLPAPDLHDALAARGIVGGLLVSGDNASHRPDAAGALLLCVTETTTPNDADQLVTALTEIRALTDIGQSQ